MEKTKDLRKRFIKKLLNHAAVLIAAVVVFGCFTMQADAATGKVTGSSVNIRKEASTTSESVGSASRGDSFTIQSEVTGADGNIWYQIVFDGGSTGYVRSDLMEKSGEVATGDTTTGVSDEGVTEVQEVAAKVTSANVRVRSAAPSGSVLTTIANDATVTVNGQISATDGYTWYRVTFGDTTGYIREDFLQLSGEVIPVDSTEVDPPVSDGEVAEDTEPVVTVKDYETLEEDGVWYLADNNAGHKYKISDIFDAAQTNADLYEKAKKTINTQKIFIIILVILLVAGGTGATLLIFKMKDMMDDAYIEEIERETLNKRQNKQQNVMHTVGKDAAQKKPTVNGQAKSQQVSGGQPRQMPKQQTAGNQARPNMTAQNSQNRTTTQSGQARTASMNGQPKSAVQNGQAGQVRTTAQSGQQAAQARTASVNGQPKSAAQSSQQAQTRTTAQSSQQATQARNASVNGQPKSAAQSSQAAQARTAAQSQQKASVKTATKSNQEWKSKNFMSEDDDDFEFEFLNWDGEEDL